MAKYLKHRPQTPRCLTTEKLIILRVDFTNLTHIKRQLHHHGEYKRNITHYTR